MSLIRFWHIMGFSLVVAVAVLDQRPAQAWPKRRPQPDDGLRSHELAGRELGGPRHARLDARGRRPCGMPISTARPARRCEAAYCVDLRGADLSGADLHGTKIKAVNFEGAKLAGSTFDGAELTGVGFGGSTVAPLPDAQLRNLMDDCRGCDFSDAPLSGRNLAGIHPSGVDFSRADLRSADLRGAETQRRRLFPKPVSPA